MKQLHRSGDQHYARARPELVKRGTDAPGAKLSDEQIAMVREVCAVPGLNKSRLARALGVSRQTIWRHARDPNRNI